MAKNELTLQEQQRQRRRRVNRIKTCIIMTIAIWMISSFLAIIILSLQIVKLTDKVNQLREENKANSSVEISTETEAGTQDTEERFQDVVVGIDTEDNFAREGDIHQVYLTFNSIPGPNTELILDVLKQYQIKATFFVVGSEGEENNHIYKRIVDEGHTVGMHSFSNKYSLLYSSIDAFQQDFDHISNYLYELTGVNSLYYRFPGGSGNEISNVNMAEFVNILNQEHIKYFDWNVSAGDAANNYTKEQLIQNVEDGVKNYKTSVVLLHDDENKATTVEALGPLIETLQAQGCQLLPIDENTNVIQYMKSDSVK